MNRRSFLAALSIIPFFPRIAIVPRKRNADPWADVLKRTLATHMAKEEQAAFRRRRLSAMLTRRKKLVG